MSWITAGNNDAYAQAAAPGNGGSDAAATGATFVNLCSTIRFYAGMPLRTTEGHNLGTLCVNDQVPRTLTSLQQNSLRVLARQVVVQLVLKGQVDELKKLTTEILGAKAALRASDQKFRAIFDTMCEFIGLLAPDGTVLEANRTALDAVGIKHTEVVGQLFSETIWWRHDSGNQAKLKEGILRAAGGEFVRFEATHRLVDGSLAIVDFSLTPVLDEHGEVRFLVPEGRDITDLKRIEDALRTSEERFRAFMNHSPAIAYMKDTEGRFVFVNEPLAARFGRPAEEWLGKTDHDFFPAEFADQYRIHDLRVMGGNKAEVSTEMTPDLDGKIIHWRSYKFPFEDSSGRRLLAGMSIDVTAEHLAEHAIRDSEERFRSVVERLAEGVILVDLETRNIVQANSTFLNLVGFTVEETVDMKLYEFLAQDKTTIDGEIELIIRQGKYKLGRRQIRRKDGAVIDVEVSVSHVTSGRQQVLAIVFRDMTEQRAHEDQLFKYQLKLEEANASLKRLSETDKLTGLNNRAAFDRKLDEEYDRAIRYCHPLSVILIDVDLFKCVNDKFGHLAGDAVLQEIGLMLKSTARLIDSVARYGGEEFAVILPDTDYAGAMILAERCRRAVATRDWESGTVTISVGVSTLSATATEAVELIQEADKALYRSKEMGRNRVTHASGTRQSHLISRRSPAECFAARWLKGTPGSACHE